MRLGIKISMASIAFAFSLTAQVNNTTTPTKRVCGTVIPDQAWDTWFNSKVNEYKQQNAQAKSAAPVVLPVIVHVIHGGQNVGSYPNMTQAQINTQLLSLNADFAGTGFNVGNLPSVFSGLVSNTGISFCYAKLDPTGDCLSEPGVDRVDYRTISGVTNPASANTSAALMSLMDNYIKPATIWDPTKYLNIWVSDVGAGAQILGYATFPANSTLSGIFGTGNSQNDGVWVWTRAFGSSGFAQAPYNKGRTATHEIGHWLGLRHIWGDSNCGTDYCNDTPVSQNDNYGCPVHPYKLGVCSLNTTGEMFMNFMDYSDDACLYLFTPDQNTRMQTALTNGTYRNQLNASSANVCNITAAAPDALFALSTGTACIDSIIEVTNNSTGGPCPTFNWSVSPGSPVTNFVFVPTASSITATPKIKFKTPGFYTLTLVATNSVGTSSSIDYIDIYDCYDFVSLSKNNFANGTLRLSPNPSNGEVYMITDFAQKQLITINVYNTTGQLVYQQQYSNVTSGNIPLNLKDQANGVYTVSVDTETQKKAVRLVIIK
jgi:hypothetical protein